MERRLNGVLETCLQSFSSDHSPRKSKEVTVPTRSRFIPLVITCEKKNKIIKALPVPVLFVQSRTLSQVQLPPLVSKSDSSCKILEIVEEQRSNLQSESLNP